MVFIRREGSEEWCSWLSESVPTNTHPHLGHFHKRITIITSHFPPPFRSVLPLKVNKKNNNNNKKTTKNNNNFLTFCLNGWCIVIARRNLNGRFDGGMVAALTQKPFPLKGQHHTSADLQMPDAVHCKRRTWTRYSCSPVASCRLHRLQQKHCT